MSIDVSCPSCNKTFKVAEQHAGKHGKCPKCGFRINIPELPAATHETPSAPFPPHRKPPVTATPNDRSLPEHQEPVSTTPRTTDERSRTSFDDQLLRKGYRFHWAVTVGIALFAVTIGYFLGRKHVKYQIRSTIVEAGKAFSEGLQESFGSDDQSDEIETLPSEIANTNLSTYQNAIPNTKDQLPEFVEFGKLFTALEFEITLVEARIDRPKIKDLFDDVGRGKDPVLIFVFRVKNTHDRKILRYRKENMFLAGHFQLRDDVDNVIRGVSYGAGSKPVGALTGNEDILPGKEAVHLELFSVPPLKTKYLILTMDLAAFGGEGKTQFMIPVENIDNFPQ